MSKAKLYPSMLVLASAIAAYELNKRSVIRNPITTAKQLQLSNRQLITDSLEGNSIPFIVNDFHVKEAEGIVQYLQQTVIMQSLRGTPDKFLSHISEIINNKEISAKDFGIVAWAPKLADDYQKKDHVREISARYEYRSNYVGRVGDKIELAFTLIEKRYIKSMDCWAVYGVNEQDNLIFYWARTLDKVCEVGRIHGRIKNHKEDEYKNKARITVLNYVKVL